MPVVINEFEALADAPAQPGRADDRTEGERNERPAESSDVALALQVLAHQSLRSWAH